jgi:hypothetical protein
MARLKSRIVTSDPSHERLDEELLPLHEGQAPSYRDTTAYARWLRARSARFRRELGTELDPRSVLLLAVK